ncbi:MAG: cytochrome c biogenesis protein CcsA [Chloroflexi bacterium]|nr:cytochrome c biogenesis protein CcsA [Chloroflexota bacterium]
MPGESAFISLACVITGVGFLALLIALIRRQETLDRSGQVLTVVASLAMLGSVIARGLATGHWPMATTYEFALAFACSTLLAALLLARRLGSGRGLVLALMMALLIEIYALLGVPDGDKIARPLLPALQTIWFEMHTFTAALAYGAGAATGGLGLMRILSHLGLWQDSLPEAERQDEVIESGVGFVFLFLSLSIITGAIWAQKAWGSYWSWDLKETWALITWFVYLLYFHRRSARHWRGMPLATLTVLGLACILFTYLGVGPLARAVGVYSLHAY